MATRVNERRERLLNARDWSTPVIGLMMRGDWQAELIARSDDLDLTWLEVYPENYMHRGPRFRRDLDELIEYYPLTSHGVHLSIGGRDELCETYLTVLKDFLDQVDAPWFSDHIGVSVHNEEVLHEIFPVPFDEPMIQTLAERANAVQDRIGRPFLLENAAYYMSVPGTDRSEADFMEGLLGKTQASMLLDVNNLWINAVNHGYSVDDYLDRIPSERVLEIHTGGFTVKANSGLLIDSHAAAPSPPVFRLLRDTLVRTGPKPVLLEWESHFSSLDRVLEELNTVKAAWFAAAEIVS